MLLGGTPQERYLPLRDSHLETRRVKLQETKWGWEVSVSFEEQMRLENLGENKKSFLAKHPVRTRSEL